VYDNLSPKPRKVRVIDHPDKVGQAVEKLLRYDVLGFDTETYHAFDRNIPAFNPCDGARMRLAQFTTPEADAYVFDLYKVDPRSFMYYMFPNKYTCVIQNAKFEEKFLQHELGIYEFGPMYDTMLAEQVLSRGRVSHSEPGFIPVGLDSIAKRTLDFDLPKDEQKSDWYKSDLSESQIYYAAMDSTVVLPIWDKQRKRLVEQRQMRVAELEFAATPAIAWMENNGFTLDKEAWLKVAHDTEEEVKGIRHELWNLLGQQQSLWENAVESINLNSKLQVQEAFERLGIALPIDDKTGNVTLSNKLLSQLHEKGKTRAVDLYVQYVKLTKRLSSFGPDWVDRINPYTGRIHCNLKQIGAETGRMSASYPNLMQIPKENFYRNCFLARYGWVLIDADYSQCELRILAELCRDPNLLKAFDSKMDLHEFTASILFEVPLDQVTKEQRGIAKNMNFLIVYGGGAYKLAAQAGVTIEIAEAILERYLNRVYPAMRDWLNKRGSDVLYHLQARTMTNRMRQYVGDLHDKKFKSKVQRHAKNYPIQGTNADITKLALTQTYNTLVKRRLVDDIKMVLPVHDEIVLDAKPEYALEAEHILKTDMLSAEGQYFRRVKPAVDSDITLKWFKEVPEEAKQEARRMFA
jgi:DNA polymerase-1